MNPIELIMGLVAQAVPEEKISYILKEAVGPAPIQVLTDKEREIYSGAIARAVSIMPSFRDALAIIRPYKDYTTATLYTDKNSRVGIGEPFFLETTSVYKRATSLLHEAMHVLYHHFTRKPEEPIDAGNDGYAADFEINCILQKHPRTETDGFVFPNMKPWNFKPDLSYEQYVALMKAKGFDNSQSPQSPQASQNSDGSETPDSSDTQQASGTGERNSSEGSEGDISDGETDEKNSENSGTSSSSSKASSGAKSDEEDGANDDSHEGDQSLADQIKEGLKKSKESVSKDNQPPSNCDQSTDERSKGADEAGIDKASPTEQTVARQNTAARVKEESDAAKGRGDKAALEMLQMITAKMQPAKVNWKSVFRKLIARSVDAIVLGRTDYSYRRVNKRLSGGEFIFPGMVKYEPTVIMGIDTSGSMDKKDYVRLLSEMEKILRTCIKSKDSFSAFCVDAAATEPQTVSKIKDLNLRGGGGTAMEIGIYAVDKIPKKKQPDIFILATDGGTSWPAFKHALQNKKNNFKTVVLITRKFSYEEARITLKGLAEVIDVSKD